MTLVFGHIISPSAPEGVGLGQKPLPVYLKAGDSVESQVDRVGSSKQIGVRYFKQSNGYKCRVNTLYSVKK